MNRNFREHQLNIFAAPYLGIGFSFEHKQQLLQEFADSDRESHPNANYDGCPGVRRLTKTKPIDPEEENADKLDPRLVGQHFDAYWQICKALGCPRYPETNQIGFNFEEVEVLSEDEV